MLLPGLHRRGASPVRPARRGGLLRRRDLRAAGRGAQRHQAVRLPVHAAVRDALGPAVRRLLLVRELAPAVVRWRSPRPLLGWRQLLSPSVAPYTMVVAGGLLFLFFGFAFTNASAWVEDQSTVNRATLHLAPLVVVWIFVCMRAWLAGTRASRAAATARRLTDPCWSSPASRWRASTPPTTRSRCARCERSAQGLRFARTLFLHRRAAGGADACPPASTSVRIARARLARRLFPLRAEGPRRRTSPRRTCCWCSGTATSSIPTRGRPPSSTATTSARGGSGSPTATRRQRRLLAALAPAARGVAGSARRARRGRGPHDRPHVPRRCSSASTASASPATRSPTASHSRPPIPSGGPSASTACSTSAA